MRRLRTKRKKGPLFWFNGFMATGWAALEGAVQFLPGMQAFVAPETYKYVGFFVVITNIILFIRQAAKEDE